MSVNQSKVFQISEVNQPITISISLPEQFIVEKVSSIDEVASTANKLAPVITSLTTDAYVNHNKKSWDSIQSLLYYWNHRDITRVERVDGYTALLEGALRALFLEAQAQYTPVFPLECENDFTPQRAVQELSDKVLSHRINHHPLLEEMANNGLALPGVEAFLQNYYVNNRLFHLFIAALSLCTPLAGRTDLANNFYDELGGGDALMAHPVLFLKNFNNIGLPSSITPQAESLGLVNAKTHAAFLSGDYHYGLGGFGFIELSMPTQMQKIFAGLSKSGLPREDLEFWETHIKIDLEHGKAWFNGMLHLVKSAEHAKKALNGGMHLLNARAAMYDGIMRFI